MKKLLSGVLCVVVGLALGFAYGQVRLKGEQKAHQTKLKEMNQRLSQAQRRYVEERTLHTSLEDDKQALQGRLDAAQKEREALARESTLLKSRAEASEAKASSLDSKAASSEARAASLDAKNVQLSERLARSEADRAALGRKQQQTFSTLQEREKELKQLTADSRKRYDQCADHNARLYEIADDLLRRYEGKGVVKTLLTKEPFTQIKKVEMEKLVQDYRDRIDQQKMGSR